MTSDLQVNATLTIHAGDTLHIIGNVEVEKDGSIINNGVLVISGNYRGKNKSTVDNNGIVLINGDLDPNGSKGDVSDNSPRNTFYVTGNSDFGGAKKGSDLANEQPGLSNEFITPQPIELLTFEGSESGGEVQLNWVTSMEESFDFFTTERAGSDMQFIAIGNLKGQGNSSVEVPYSFTDETPLSGQSFYRLKATDIDRTIEYHRIITVMNTQITSENIQVYPNPIANHELKVVSNQDHINEIQLMDLSGRMVFSQKAHVGMTSVQLPGLIQPGSYVLVVVNSLGGRYQERIMVL